MMNGPYAPWNVSRNSTPQTERERLLYLIEFAVLAPSSHNTQPWRFRIRGAAIEVSYAAGRKLLIADPTDRQLYLSLGAAIENMVRAASSIGVSAQVRYVLQDELVAVIEFKDGAGTPFDWRPIMAERRSTRLAFDPAPLPAPVADKFKSSTYGKAHSMLVEDSAGIDKVAQISADASNRALANPIFRGELVKWVRNNWTRQGDGMPGFVQNIPGPVSLLAPVIMRLVNVGPDQAKKDYALFKASPAVVIVGVEADEPSQWLDAGRSIEAIWLEAQRAGYQVSALASAIEDETGRQELQAAFTSTNQPVAVMRVGHANHSARHSPRLAGHTVTDA